MDTPMKDMPNSEQRVDKSEEIHLPLSEKERRILDLYDRLIDLEVEKALINARQSTTLDAADILPESINHAKQQLLEARSSWMLRNDVVNGVMMVNPIIKAVHRGTDASPIERDLLPHIEQRDEVSTVIAKQDIDQHRITDELTSIQIETIRVSRRNVQLASEVLELAEAANQDKAQTIDDQAMQEEISRLERELKASRQKWKIMKGTASAVIAGSGVDWVKDQELRDIVLDPD